MSELNDLRVLLQPHLDWHGACVLFVAAFIMALFRARTVNLSELSVAFPDRAKPESQYKCQQRFFRHLTVDYAVLAHLVIAVMVIPGPWVLAIDRAQWDIGERMVNILTLGRRMRELRSHWSGCCWI